MKVIKASFNYNLISIQIDKTIAQIEELLIFISELMGKEDGLALTPALLQDERPKALEPLIIYAEEVLASRDYLIKDIEVQCRSVATRLEKVTEANDNYTCPIFTVASPKTAAQPKTAASPKKK